MSVTHQFVMLGGKVQVEEASKPSRVQSLRSSNIRNHLIHKDVVQLSDGLTKLEVLLKSGVVNEVHLFKERVVCSLRRNEKGF